MARTVAERFMILTAPVCALVVAAVGCGGGGVPYPPPSATPDLSSPEAAAVSFVDDHFKVRAWLIEHDRRRVEVNAANAEQASVFYAPAEEPEAPDEGASRDDTPAPVDPYHDALANAFDELVAYEIMKSRVADEDGDTGRKVVTVEVKHQAAVAAESEDADAVEDGGDESRAFKLVDVEAVYEVVVVELEGLWKVYAGGAHDDALVIDGERDEPVTLGSLMFRDDKRVQGVNQYVLLATDAHNPTLQSLLDKRMPESCAPWQPLTSSPDHSSPEALALSWVRRDVEADRNDGTNLTAATYRALAQLFAQREAWYADPRPIITAREELARAAAAAQQFTNVLSQAEFRVIDVTHASGEGDDLDVTVQIVLHGLSGTGVGEEPFATVARQNADAVRVRQVDGLWYLVPPEGAWIAE